MEATASTSRDELPELPASPRQLNYHDLDELPTDASGEEKKGYAAYMCEMYRSAYYLDRKQLRNHFRDDLKNYTLDDFRSLENTLRKELRDLLRSRGVYVEKKERKSIAEALFEAVQNPLHDWPMDDDERPPSTAPSSQRPSPKPSPKPSPELSPSVPELTKLTAP